MKSLVLLAAVAAAALTMTAVASAADPIVPFPSQKVGQVFLAAQTLTTDGVVHNSFAPGSKVVFRAYAVDSKTKKLVSAKDIKFFYVTIPNEPNLKLQFTPTATGASKMVPWTGTWTIPANYPQGVVGFKVLVKVKDNHKGSFVQMPVVTSMLTVAATPQPVIGAPAPSAGIGLTSEKPTLTLYVDSVNGTAPAGTAARPIGCTQTNVYHRGERVVIRSWGATLSDGSILSDENVKEAHYSIAGQPDVLLTWGAHGNTGAKVWFWTNFWIVPKDFPLGETTVHVSFTTEDGKTGTYDYTINVIP